MEAKTTTRLSAIFWISALFVLAASQSYGEQTAVKSTTRLPRGMKTSDSIPTWNYLLHLPSGYSRIGNPWPTIIYLHGKSIRGSDMKTNKLKSVKRYGIPAFLDRTPDFPFIVISPQLPENSWPEKSLIQLIDGATRKYNIDRDRIYLTGVDIGGAGVWYLAAANQKKFAAIAPLTGNGDPSLVSKLTEIPIWAFHGDADRVTPHGPHQRLVEAVQKAGGNAKISIIPGGTHGDIIFPTYQRKDLYDWFLSHSRAVVAPKPEPEPEPESIAKPVSPIDKMAKIFKSPRKTYVVKRGDTLWSISKANGTTVDALRTANELNSNVIKITQELIIPTPQVN